MRIKVLVVLALFSLLCIQIQFTYAVNAPYSNLLEDIDSIDVARTILITDPSNEEYLNRILELFKKNNEIGIKVFIDGEMIRFEKYGVGATVVNGKLLLPLRSIGESLGADITWNENTKLAEIGFGQEIIKLTAFANTATINGIPIKLDVPGQIVDGRVMIPLKFILDILDKEFVWIDGGKDLKILSIYNK